MGNFHLINLKSGEKGKVPAADLLHYGELAVNYAEGGETIFLKNSKDAIVEIKPHAVVADELSKKQDKTDNALATTDKTVTGAINEVKCTFKNLNTPIPISTENTTESKAQNAKNIADYVEKAKAAGIADVNGMGVTCIINNNNSGVGYFYGTAADAMICGIQVYDDVSNPFLFSIGTDGNYMENEVVIKGASEQVSSFMLVQGARSPIILTPDTTEVDEETYKKLLSNDTDVLFMTDLADGNICTLTYKVDNADNLALYFTCLSVEASDMMDSYLYAYKVSITKTSPHTCSITENVNNDFSTFLDNSGYINKSTLNPILWKIDLTGTNEGRKGRIEVFEENWKALAGINALDGARFIGDVSNLDNSGNSSVLFIRQSATDVYVGCAMVSDVNGSVLRYSLFKDGSLTITPLFSHLEAVTIYSDNTEEHMQANLDNIAAYVANLRALGVSTSKGYTIPVLLDNNDRGYIIGLGTYGSHTGYYTSSSGGYSGILVILFNGTCITIKLQPTEDTKLATTSKTITGAINELKATAESTYLKKTEAAAKVANALSIAGVSFDGSSAVSIDTIDCGEF